MNDDLYVIPVTFVGPLGSMVLNLALIVGPDRDTTLVDASMPGHVDEVAAALAADGFSMDDLRQIVVTHQDVDHIGSLAAIKIRSCATVIAHSIEAPYIEGKERLVKYPSQERLDQNPGMKEIFDQIGFAPVDRLVEDGDLLEIGGGTRVIHTPGHTPGHISLFLERSKTLISGDALTSADGQLAGPSVGATPDYSTAVESVKKLAALPEVNAIVTYHGGLVTDDPLGQLRRVAASL
ncbi:MBL fold metallo-hydrolase [Fimbriimonas ginsengisoli]|uniref:Metal-dependent hydrolase n=1 Tax=Fimbriimonas ginsengisoli Gsoil 348 TaxID=661478 RepID=A0A068NLP8_FIMGI|nr:MBL fold metallo-hydrolase [Fimbriimonas ginsengisoli]AIE83685.1 Metal-dependent hydrolase [Fimbriimonas ginsengisoli Gsoil 348]